MNASVLALLMLAQVDYSAGREVTDAVAETMAVLDYAAGRTDLRVTASLGSHTPGDVGTSAEAVRYYPNPDCPECTQHDITQFEQAGINYRIEIAPAWCRKRLPVIHWQDRSGQWFHESYKSCVSQVQRVLGLVASTKPAVVTLQPTPRASVPSTTTQSVVGGFSKQRSTRGGLYYRGQTQWSWPGDLRSHLVGTHGLSWDTVNGWSDGQVMAYHNQDHNSGGPRRKKRSSLFATSR
jgi:hypothetical protein